MDRVAFLVIAIKYAVTLKESAVVAFFGFINRLTLAVLDRISTQACGVFRVTHRGFSCVIQFA
jgi:hypothetical protein